jgi:soluble P-type ATPase
MLEIDIPGHLMLRLQHLVLDYNGTLAQDGVLIGGVKERLHALSSMLQIHIVTGDTFGKARDELIGIPCELLVLPAEGQGQLKRQYIQQLGCETTVCIGNGRNDRLMLKEAGLSIAVVQTEGAATQTVLAATVLSPDILAALDLLIYPLRLVATLRS